MNNKDPKSNNTSNNNTREFELTPKEIRTNKILAITYAVWALVNIGIFIPHFMNQQFEELFPFTSLDWKYYNFFSLIIFTFFIPEIIRFIIKYHRIRKRNK